MLSRTAEEFAAEISNHDWSDAPYRGDRAGHRREDDTNKGDDVLSEEESETLRLNVMWVTAQVLKHADPNLDLHEFAEACGVPRRITRNQNGDKSGTITEGIRMNRTTGLANQPGGSHLHDQHTTELSGEDD